MDKDQKTEFLMDLYYKQNYQRGRDAIYYYTYHTLGMKNISRRFVADFLANQTSHQLLTERKPSTDIRPQLSSKIGSILQQDLQDWSKSPDTVGDITYKYVYVCIDILSKKVWIAALKNKTTEDIIPEIDKVVKELTKGGHVVRLIQQDNGGEFNISYPEREGHPPIKSIRSRPATPENNSIVERVNKTLKSILFRLMLSNKTKHWVQFLPDIQKVYNSTYNRSIDSSPDVAYAKNTEQEAELYEHIRAKKRKAYKEIETVLKVNQKVRIVIPKLKIKTKGEAKWSNEIYTIVKVVNANPLNFTQPRYKLADTDNKLVKNMFSISSLLVLPDTYTES